MLKIDETELIEFFETLPLEQDPGEKEFFGTTIFEIQQDGLHLTISFSAHYHDCYLDLKTDQAQKPFLELKFYNVQEVKVKHDKPGSLLRIVAPGDDIYSTVYNDTYAYMSGTSMARVIFKCCGLRFK